MTIFRGPGGGGNATTDAEINALAAISAEATASALVAANAATAAGVSEGNAASSAAAAASSASGASTSATTATTQASAASTSASGASTSATNASNSATAAANSAASIDDATFVHKTGNETIGGIKTFSSTIVGSVSGNASTVTTNANLTGAVTSAGNSTSLGSFTSAQLAGALTDETGSGPNVFATSPTLVTPALGTPSALVGTNITGIAASLSIGGNAGTATALSGVVGSAPSYSCRAWVNFNGTGTVAIRASGNVASITDNGAGDYTVNFTTSMSDANYATIGMNGSVVLNHTNFITGGAQAQEANSVRVRITNGGTTVLYDRDYVFVSIFR